MIKEITIRYGDHSGYDVLQDGMSSGGHLTVGEMIEQVLSITLKDAARKDISVGRAWYALKPQEDWRSKVLNEDFFCLSFLTMLGAVYENPYEY